MHGPDGAGPWEGTAGHRILGYGFGPVTPAHALPWLRGNDIAGVVELSRDVPAAEPRGAISPAAQHFKGSRRLPGLLSRAILQGLNTGRAEHSRSTVSFSSLSLIHLIIIVFVYL